MADILPYLGVEQTFSEDDIAGKSVVLTDMTGLTKKEAEKLLKEQGITCKTVGNSETVTAQLPQAGASVPGGSEVLLYFGEESLIRKVTVPNLVGMNRAQANDAAGALGLYILVSGNTSVAPNVTAVTQSIPPGTEVDTGTTIRVEFIDTKAAD